ncbi:MAG: hypothetical protein HY257_08750 [Chloroflexi bacterium]|nr:hypothetical protein [Chloroflexota bacterium]
MDAIFTHENADFDALASLLDVKKQKNAACFGLTVHRVPRLVFPNQSYCATTLMVP